LNDLKNINIIIECVNDDYNLKKNIYLDILKINNEKSFIYLSNSNSFILDFENFFQINFFYPFHKTKVFNLILNNDHKKEGKSLF
jgi:hypothetical protein